MPLKKKKIQPFSSILDPNEKLCVTLTDSEIQDVKTEFVWFFTGQNNAQSLLASRNMKFLDALYLKYLTEIKKMRDYYGLEDIIEGSDYVHGWFKDWKKLEVFSKEQFLQKAKADESFALIWADLGFTDSLELRNWDLQIQYDGNDNASLKKPGKDQLTDLINSLVADPENGFHCITLFNPSNTSERLIPVGMITAQFQCVHMNYEERVWWFFENHYETGLEYEILLETMKGDDLDKFKWYDEFISLPKYRLGISSTHNRLRDRKDYDTACLFSTMFLKTLSKLLNMEPMYVSVSAVEGPKKTRKSNAVEITVNANIEPKNGTKIKDTDISVKRINEPSRVHIRTAD